MELLLTGLIFGITLILLLFLLSMVWPPDSPWSPWWRTNRTVAKVICTTAKIKKTDVIYDLGCGDGTALITAAKMVGATGVGVDIDPARIAIAKVKALVSGVSGKAHFERKNLFTTDITAASVIFVYLIPKTLKRLEPKFCKELKPGSRVVSYIYQIDYLAQIAHDEKHQVYVYEIPIDHKQ
jgi:ribosomal protein L11 methylase PrmA